MKSKLLSKASIALSVAWLFSAQCFAQNNLTKNSANRVSSQATDSWFSNAQTYLEKSSAFFQKHQNKFIAVSDHEKLSFKIDGGTMEVKSLNGENITQSSIKLQNLNSKSVEKNILSSFIQKDNYIKYSYPDYSIEYINGASGLRQNFIINERPSGNEDLSVTLKTTGDLTPRVLNEKTLALYSADGKIALQYDGLAAWDANDKKLSAAMVSNGANSFKIVVNDKDAVYPVTIDPLTHNAEWQGSANGVLPALLTNLQLQIDALYGYKVTGLGDVNGDGYDDVAISAPAAIDIVAGNTILGAGAVFVYFGSAAGLPAAPSRTLRSSTPVANALFGLSVAAGNVTGDGKADIIVGAPAESYTTSVSGLPASATVTAGKVYVFNGQTISGARPYTSASLFLNGSVYFSNGIAGLLAANGNINALFGFSVAATEDMNNDGLGEIVIGAPGYANAALVNVRTGAAFVYMSNDIATNTPTRLTAPTTLSIPGLLDLGGLLFGFSVDGAGDYNKDGRPDVIVGAPAGLNLAPNSFLGGSAYIYTGTGSGVNTTQSVQLTSSTGLTGSVANLFGFSVKGMKNAAGIRNGNIIVAAPVSSVLTNVVNGLRLKAGSLNIFTAKLNPAANETPVQSLTSPRADAGILAGVLSGLNLEVSLLFGASMDNIQDADCDGFGDLVVGEPLSTGVGLVGVNAVGGAAYIFRGKPDGTYNTMPYWTLENDVTLDAGINAGSLLGYTVAGIGQTRGSGNGYRILIGAPGGALDYSTGVLNLGNTLGTTFNFAAGNNGLGKSYTYSFNNCSVVPVKLASFTATAKNCDAQLQWEMADKTGLSFTEAEQSPDGVHFSTVQKIIYNSDEARAMSISAAQKNMIAYYRLKFVQENGSITYSDVKKVRTACSNADVLQAYPTLFNNEVKVIFSAAVAKGNSVLMLLDVYGRRILSKNINVLAGDNPSVINGSLLAPGVYYVQITGENYKSETVKIVKQ